MIQDAAIEKQARISKESSSDDAQKRDGIVILGLLMPEIDPSTTPQWRRALKAASQEPSLLRSGNAHAAQAFLSYAHQRGLIAALMLQIGPHCPHLEQSVPPVPSIETKSGGGPETTSMQVNDNPSVGAPEPPEPPGGEGMFQPRSGLRLMISLLENSDDLKIKLKAAMVLYECCSKASDDVIQDIIESNAVSILAEQLDSDAFKRGSNKLQEEMALTVAMASEALSKQGGIVQALVLAECEEPLKKLSKNNSLPRFKKIARHTLALIRP